MEELNDRRVVYRDHKEFDVTLALVTLGLCIFGLVIVPSAGAGLGIPASAFKMQKVWVATGLLLLLAAAFIDYAFICRFYIPIIVVNVALLAAVILIKRITHEDLMREIGWPLNGRPSYSFSVMPSEFSKIFTVIFFAKAIDTLQDKINNFFVLIALVAAAVVPFGLIFLQPALSASVVILFIAAVMLYVGKLKLRYFAIAAVLLAAFAAFFYYDLNRDPEERVMTKLGFQAYQIEDRIMPFIDPEYDPKKLYQTNQSKRAISSGGLYGNGLNGNQVHVPEGNNDFIFAIVCSEFGFFGALAVLAAGFFIVFKCLLIAWKSDVFLGKLVAAGVGATFAFHMFVNVGVASGLLPNTGITFPFISSGGSSIWISMASVGLVINVKMTKTKSMFE